MIIETTTNPYCKNSYFIEFDDDYRKYIIQNDQKWLPKSVDCTFHPAKVGDIVTLSKWAVGECGVKIGIVGAIRKHKQSRSSDCDTYYQVEILGASRRWIDTGHCLEYQQKENEKYDYHRHGCRTYKSGRMIYSKLSLSDF